MIIWIDTETTGLDPHNGELLEIAVVVTDDKFNLVAVHSEVMHHDLDEAILDDWIVKTHGESGLLGEVAESKQSVAEVEEFLVKSLTAIMGQDEMHKTPLGGSSVHFDRKWLEVHMPQLIGLLSHRHLDASTLSLAAKHGNPRLYNKRKKSRAGESAHRALDDIFASIADAKFYADRMGRRKWFR